MLKKILKYEMRAAWRTEKLVWKLLIFISLFIGLLSGFFITYYDSFFITEGGKFFLGAITGEDIIVRGTKSGTILSTILTVAIFVWAALIIAIFISTLNRIAHSFSREMFGGQGYLTHTLPVEPWQILAGKALAALFILFLAALSVLFSSFLIAIPVFIFREGIFALPNAIFKPLLRGLQIFFKTPVSSMKTLLYSLLTILKPIQILLEIQLAIIAAHQLKRHHKLYSLIALLVIVMIDVRLLRLVDSTLLFTIESILFSAICFFISNWFMTHRLNLE